MDRKSNNFFLAGDDEGVATSFGPCRADSIALRRALRLSDLPGVEVSQPLYLR